MAEARPFLSVIVTSYSKDRLPDVFDLLESLKAQTCRHIEVLFVGEREPELCVLVRAHAAQLGMANVITLFNDGEPGLSAARNVAVPKAKGGLIAFLDDDVVAFPEWAEAVVRAFAETDAVGVTGPALPLWDEPGMAWFPEELYWVASCTAWSAWDQVREVRNAWGMNMAFRQEAFNACGLFSTEHGFPKGSFEGGLGEDNEFSMRVRLRTGKPILYVPTAKVWHKVHRYRLRWSFIRKRAYGLGRSRRSLLRFRDAGNGAGDLLNPERDLLGRIMTRRIPKDLVGFLRTPSTAWRRLSVTFWALCFVALGYYSHLLPGRNAAVAPKGSKGGEV